MRFVCCLFGIIMKKIFVFAIIVMLVACKVNPFTGKSTLNFVSNSEIFPTAFSQYKEFLQTHKVIKNTPEAKMIESVGKRIANAANIWLEKSGYKDYLKDYQWEYHLVEDKQVNAWCMPGGKIVVYTGILPITQDERGLAVVLGHEIAHALADHGAQRMSAAALQQAALAAGTQALENTKYKNYTSEFQLAYGLVTQLGVMLPFSRDHENEADAIGIQIMAIAGYDPAEAPELWKRMEKMSGSNGMEFLSTHPSAKTRIRNLTALVPKARAQAYKFGVKTFN